MAHVGMLLFGALMVLFAIGWIGCALTIPMAAFKFLAVLFEKDQDEASPEDQYPPQYPKPQVTSQLPR
jgi:hypothetical protein